MTLAELRLYGVLGLAGVVGTILAGGVLRAALGALAKGLVGKELRHLFWSPIAWLTMAGVAFVNGYVFIYLFAYYAGRPNEPLVRVFFGEQNGYFWIVQLIAIPAITMRLIAEERSSGTIETLMTAPVRESEVIAGKFLGALVFYAALWAPTLILVGAAFVYGAPDGFLAGLGERAGDPAALWAYVSEVMDAGPIVSSYLGTLLMGGAWIAVGLLASSFCRTQVIAFISSFVVLLGFFSVGYLEGLITRDPAWAPGLRAAVRYVSFPYAFDPFPRGLIDTRSVVWFASLTLVALFLATRVLESHRWR